MITDNGYNNGYVNNSKGYLILGVFFVCVSLGAIYRKYNDTTL